MLDDGHALAGAAAKAELGEAREVGVDGQGFAVGGVGRKEEAGGVEGFGLGIGLFVAGDGPVEVIKGVLVWAGEGS